MKRTSQQWFMFEVWNEEHRIFAEDCSYLDSNGSRKAQQAWIDSAIKDYERYGLVWRLVRCRVVRSNA